MKKIVLLFLLSSTYIFSNINTVVSILPAKTFVKAIGGEHVTVTVMVQAGDSPHSYEPKPSQMLSIAKAELYFAMGVEFEKAWLPKFTSLNPNMKLVHLNDNIKTIDMPSSHSDHDADHEHEEEHHHLGTDPHIWTSPENVAIIAQNIYDALSKIDPENHPYYKNNLVKFLEKVSHTDAQIEALFSNFKGSKKFMVFHPSWGYFANAYGLEQVAVEVEGKSPKPRELVHLLQEAKEEKVSAIFTQPEFSDASAKVIAKELDIPVIKITPLAANWSENLLMIAKSIAGKK